MARRPRRYPCRDVFAQVGLRRTLLHRCKQWRGWFRKQGRNSKRACLEGGLQWREFCQSDVHFSLRWREMEVGSDTQVDLTADQRQRSAAILDVLAGKCQTFLVKAGVDLVRRNPRQERQTYDACIEL
ncbi:hypothetical protein [Arenibacterium sp. LLYu02]|uniref:hypothetical protein n=1 Tax=Arenibacterium sp. LLYu02 TaxID=3404132 RepID=UPI003B22252C